MMKIDGIDPLILNRIKEQTDRLEIQRTEQSVTDNRIKRRQGSAEERRSAYLPDTQYSQKLDQALERLNEKAGERDLTLRFRVQKDSRPWMVDIIDTAQNVVVRQIPTDQALDVVNRINSLIGLAIDDRR